MRRRFTTTDLVKDIYEETNYMEHMFVESELQKNTEMEEDYAEMQKAKQFLDSARLKPSKSVLKNILAYSKKAFSAKSV